MSTDARDRGEVAVGEDRAESFAEAALKLGGKSAEEARRTGAIDAADDQVERLFQPQYQTVNSPVHRAVWDRWLPTGLFTSKANEPDEQVRQVMDRSYEIVLGRRRAGALLDSAGKIRADLLDELGQAGYWGLLVDREYGGSGARFQSFATFLTRMATADPTIAGLASVHGCIGAVDPVRTFGSEEQKRRFLPELASGRRLSAFALTEPCAGSDLTALRTTARLVGDQYLVNGEKLFITNVLPGRTIGLVCLIEGRPAVLVCDLPDQETESFQLRRYGLWALKHTHNQGMVFRDFAVPAANLLEPGRGDGLTIAYHGLNLGRVALCANAAGTMRLMMASILPWAQYRVTYGERIVTRELVRRRVGRLAGMIVACDALVQWCARLLDEGYRGEMECIIAKIFGSEAQKTASIEFLMKTHGGRSFLHGHMFGDNVHEYLAPCIYEGEGEMLGMAFFKSLVKHHGMMYFEPIGRALQQAGIRQPNLANPRHVWALRGPLWNYSKWYAAHHLMSQGSEPLPHMPDRLREHAEFAVAGLRRSGSEISGVMRKHQLRLADRQCRMAELSERLQNLVVILCTSLYASRIDDELTRDAADVICGELRRRNTGERASDGELRRVTRLGEAIAEGGFAAIAGLEPDKILMPYDNPTR